MKDIPGYEGQYAVTSCGKIWSYKNKKFLKQALHNEGYLIVNLSKNGIQKNHYVHRLVACAFIDNPDSLKHINHKDENKSNNSINNLEWCDSKYNNNYGTHNKRISERMSKKVICAETGIIYASAKEVKLKLGISDKLVQANCNMKYKKTHGLHFFYLDYYNNHFEELRNELKTKLVYCEQLDEYFENCTEAGKRLRIRRELISKVCNGKCKTANGLVFRYVEMAVIP